MSFRVRTALLCAALVSVIAVVYAGRSLSRHTSHRAFYYWKTEWTGSHAALERLAENRTDRLYMRFFDVAWDERGGAPAVVAPLRFAAAPPDGIEIVPVVYLTNAVFLKIAYADVEPLADRVLDRVQRMSATRGVAFRELDRKST